MRKLTILSILAMIAFVLTLSADAQGLGGLIKKGKEVVKGKEMSNGIESVNGIEVINPIKAYMDVEPVGLYGVPKTESKGDVYLVLKVRNKESKETALFGSSIQNKKMMAADDNGNVYNIDSSGAMRYDTPSDMMVKIVMDAPSMMFMDVPVGMTLMPIVKLGISLDAYHQGNLTFKNVPIFWDVEPE